MKKFQRPISIILSVVFIFMNLTPVSSIAQDVIPESADYTYEVSAADYADEYAAEADASSVEASAVAAPAEVSAEPSVTDQPEPVQDTQPPATENNIPESSEAVPSNAAGPVSSDVTEAVSSDATEAASVPAAQPSETSAQPASAEAGASTDPQTDAAYQEQESSQSQTESVTSDQTEEPVQTEIYQPETKKPAQDQSQDPTETSGQIETSSQSETASETLPQEESQTESSVQETESETQIQYPAVTLTQKVKQANNEIEVTAQLPEGAVPEGTTMQLAAIDISQGLIQSVAKETKKDVEKLWAIYIGFFDKDGNRIYPAQPVYLTIDVPDMYYYSDDMKTVVTFNNDAKPYEIKWSEFNLLKIKERKAEFYTTDFYNFSSFVFAVVKEPESTTAEETSLQEETTAVVSQEELISTTEPSGEETTEEEPSTEETTEEETTAQETTTEEETTTEAPRTKTVYTYDDEYVQVTAVLANPEAVPDDAELVVKPVFRDSQEYNYDAYMKALNDAGVDEYNEENTLLYDISFMVQDKDEEGKPLETFSEYEPEEGSVAVSISFKSRQLTDSLEAEKSSDVEVVHLAADKTKDTATISDVEIAPQTVNANVNLNSGETVKFDTTSFSVYAISHVQEEEASITIDLSSYFKEGKKQYPYVKVFDEETNYISFSDLLAYVQAGSAASDPRIIVKDVDVKNGDGSYVYSNGFLNNSEVSADGLNISRNAIVLTKDMEGGSVTLSNKRASLTVKVRTKSAAVFDEERGLYIVEPDAVSVAFADFDVDSLAASLGITTEAAPLDIKGTRRLSSQSVNAESQESDGKDGLKTRTVSGAVGLDIDVDGYLPEEGTYLVPVSLAASPIDMIGNAAENAKESIKIVRSDVRLYHIVDGKAEPVNAEFEVSADGKINGFEFETNGFSPYMITYTVDFTYTDEQGEEHAFSLKGQDQYALTDILTELGIKFEKIESAELELVETVGETDDKALYLTGDAETGYVLHSDVAFDDIYVLTVVADGKTYVITVKDEQNYQVEIQYVDSNGNNLPSVTLPAGKYYYVYCQTNDNGDKVYAFALPSTSGTTTINKFVNSNNQEVDYNGTNVSEQSIRKVNENADQQMSSIWRMKDVNGNCRLRAGDSFAGLEIVSIDTSTNGKTTFTLKELPKYTINVQFLDKDGQNTKPNFNENYYIRSYVNSDNVPWFSFTKLNPDANGSQNISIAEFVHRDDNNRKINYSDSLNVNTSFVTGEDKNLSSGLGNGSVLKSSDGKQYSLSFTTTTDGINIIAKEAVPYKYSISASDGVNVTFDNYPDYNGNWYLLSTLTKSDGKKYYYVKQVGNTSTINAVFNQEISTYYNSNQLENISISSPSGNTSVYQSTDTVENVLVYTGSSQANNYNDIVQGANRTVYKNGDVIYKYTFSSTSADGVGTMTFTPVRDLTLETNFVEHDGTSVTAGLPDDYYLLIKMVRNGKNYYALQKVEGNGPTNPGNVVFFEYNNGTVGTTPYYYSGTETISTQVVTGTSKLSSAIQGGSTIVKYNENIADSSNQYSDLTKDLYSTGSVINKNVNPYEMTTTFKKQKNDGVAHTIEVNFYSEQVQYPGDDTKLVNNAELDTTAGSYYFVVRLYNEGKLVAYKVKAAENVGNANSGGKFTTTIDADETFIIVDDKGIDIANSDHVEYDPTMYTSKVRLYKANTPGSLPDKLANVNNYGTDTLPGYTFAYNESWKDHPELKTDSETKTKLGLYSSTEKIYQIKVYIPSTAGDVGTDQNIKLNEIVKHASGGDDVLSDADVATAATQYGPAEDNQVTTKGTTTITEENGNKVITYVLEDQTGENNVFHWSSKAANQTITGNESFDIWLTQNGLKLTDGYPVKINGEYYDVEYDTDTLDDNGVFLPKNVEVDNVNHRTIITHYVRLTKANFQAAIGPYDVLGDGAEFGVIANEYIQRDHTETNFAANSYVNPKNKNIEIDGSGGNAMPFYAGEIHDHLWFSGANNVNLDVYVSNEYSSVNHGQQGDGVAETIWDTTSSAIDVTVFPISKGDVNSKVNGFINYLKSSSANLAAQPSIPVKMENHVVDITMFPDNKTIYIDATGMDFASDGWHIKKKPGQTIVFNIPDDYVMIREFDVTLYDEDGEKIKDPVKSNTGGNGGYNEDVENVILEHVVFNAYNASLLEPFSGPAGLFLCPNGNVVENSGSGTGWIATGGTFDQVSSEWHFFRANRHYARDTAGFKASKFMNRLAGDSLQTPTKSFSFVFEKLNREDGTWDPISTATNNGSVIKFAEISYDAEDQGENYYRIREIGTPVQGIEFDGTQYIVKVDVTADVSQQSLSHTEEYYQIKPKETSILDSSILENKNIDVHKVQKTGSSEIFLDETERKTIKVIKADNLEQVTGSESVEAIKFVNTYVGQYCLAITKAWDDEDDRDGVRPDAVLVKVQKEVQEADGSGTTWVDLTEDVPDSSGQGTKPQAVVRELNAANNWTAMVKGVDKYGDDGLIIKYRWVETAMVFDTGNNEVTVDAVLSDAPDSTGNVSSTFTYWVGTNGAISKTETAGYTQVSYTSSVESVDTKTSEEEGGTITYVTKLTNTHEKTTTVVEAKKEWKKTNDQGQEETYLPAAGTEEVTFRLLAEYTADGKTYEVSNITTLEGKQIRDITLDGTKESYSENEPDSYEADSWLAKWTNLPEYYDGHKITYKVVEIEIPLGYSSSAETAVPCTENNGIWTVTIENTLERGSLKFTKSLFVDGVDKSNDYSAITGDGVKTFYAKVYGIINGEKYWVQDTNGTLVKDSANVVPNIFPIYPIDTNKSNTITISNLPEGEYTVVEVADSNGNEISSSQAPSADMGKMTFQFDLSRTEDSVTVAKDSNNSATASLLNSYISGKYCIAVTKQWLVNGSVSVPDGQTLTVRLERSTDGKNWTPIPFNGDGSDTTEKSPTVVLNKANNWSAVAIGMDQMDADGNRYSYRWVEMDGENPVTTAGTVINGWSMGNSQTIQQTTKDGATLIFLTKLVNSKVTANIPVKKTLEGNQYDGEFTFALAKTAGTRTPDSDILPEDAIVTLKGGELKQFGDITYSEPGNYSYTITEDTTAIDGMTYDEAASSGKTVDVIVGWNNETDKDYLVIKSVKVGETDVRETGVEFTNTYHKITAAPEVTKDIVGNTGFDASEEFTFTLASDEAVKADGTTAITPVPMPTDGTSVTIKDDETGAFGDITFTQEGTYYYTITEVLKTGDNATNGMIYNNTPKYVKVEVTENSTTKALSAEITYSDSKDGTYSVDNKTIRNTYSLTEVPVTKVWEDDSNNDGVRPDTITVGLYKSINNGEETLVKTVTLGTADFATTTTREGEDAVVTVDSNSWTYTFTDLPAKEYVEGTLYDISYSVKEMKKEGDNYVAIAAGSALDANYIVTYDTNNNTITNTHTPKKTLAKVIKNWDDNENQDGKRSDYVTMKLYANNAETGIKITLKGAKDPATSYVVPDSGNYRDVKVTVADDKLSAIVKDLPVYIGGIKQTYTWVEDQTGLTDYTIKSISLADISEEGYETGVKTQATITNTYTPGRYCLTVNKEWDDQGNKYNLRPGSITVELYRRDKAIAATGTTVAVAAGQLNKVENFRTDASNNDTASTITLSAANNWTAMVLGVDKYVGGKEQEYFWKETSVPAGYTLSTSNTETIDGVTYIKANEGSTRIGSIKNTLDKGKLTIEKQFEFDPAHTLTDEEKLDLRHMRFVVTGWADRSKQKVVYPETDFYLARFTESNGTYTLNLDNLPLGYYEITEDASGVVIANYHLTGTEINESAAGDDKKATVTLSKDDTTTEAKENEASVAYKNKYERDKGDLSIAKVVDGALDGEADTEFTFTVTLKDAEGIPLSGTYKGQIGQGSETEYVFGTDGKNRTSIELKGGETFLLKGLPTGTTYTVTEAANDKYDLTDKQNDTGTIIKDITAAAEFKNTRKTGQLTVTKTVESDGSTDGEFTVTITLKNGNEPYSGTFHATKNGTAIDDINFTNGSAEITGVKHNDAIVIKGLPIGLNYTVTETSANGFSTTYNGKTETTPASGTIAAETIVNIINTKLEGKLAVYKTVDSPVDADKASTKRFTFTITMKDSDGKIVVTTYDATNKPTANYFIGELTKPGQHESSLSRTRTIVFDENGQATIDLAHDETMTIIGIPAGYTYEVTETTDSNFTTQYYAGTAAPVSGTVYTDGNAVENQTVADKTTKYAAFKNTRKNAPLTIDKTVVSDVEAEKTADYTFTVRLMYGGQALSGKYNVDYYDVKTNTTATSSGEVSFSTEGEATITVKGGGKAVIKDLPIGATVHIVEQINGVFESNRTDENGNNIQNANIVITENDNSAHFKNTRKTGGLDVGKTVNSDENTDKTRSYNFTVELYSEYNGTTKTGTAANIFDGENTTKVFTARTYELDGTTTSNAIDTTITFHKETNRTYATFELTNKQHLVIEGLPVGVKYVVSEEDLNGIVRTSTGEIGTIVSGDPNTADFTNTRAESGLIVSKSVVSDLSRDKNKDYSFTLTLWRVAEKPEDTTKTGYDRTHDRMANETFAAAVIKRGNGITDETAVNLTTDDNGQYTFKLKHGQILVINHLPENAPYTVTEAEDNANSDFEVTKLGDSGIIRSNGANLAEFINTRKPSVLKITKSVVSPIEADQARTFEYKVKLYDLKKDAQGNTLPDVDANRDYLRAFIAGRYFEGADGATFYVQAGHTLTLTGIPADVHYIVEEQLGEDGRFEIVKAGAVTRADNNTDRVITEADIPVDAKPIVTGVTNSVNATEVGFINKRSNDRLKLQKTVVSPVDNDQTIPFIYSIFFNEAIGGRSGELFPVTTTGNVAGSSIKTTASGAKVLQVVNGKASVTMTGGSTLEVESLPIGVTYTVVETVNNDFTADVLERTGTIVDGGTDGSGVATAAFVNTRNVGALEVTKTVESSSAADQNQEFEFRLTFKDTELNAESTNTVGDKLISYTKTAQDGSTTQGDLPYTFKLKGGEKLVITGLPVGVEYTVEESAVSGFITTKTGETGIISAGTTRAAFTNIRQQGGLIVSKSVQSDVDADKLIPFNYTVVIGDRNVSGKYGDMEFFPAADETVKESTARFTLKDGETKSATGLPDGVSYTVTEILTASQGEIFTQTSSGTVGNIVNNETKTAAFTNTRKTGDLTISKTVVSDVPADASKAYTFDVILQVNGVGVSGTYSGITFTDGNAVVTVHGADSVTLTGLPVKATWSVTERLTDEEKEIYAVKANGRNSDNATGTISETETSSATFENTRKTGSLSIEKSVVSPLAADKNKEYKFTIYLDEDIDKTYDRVSFTNGVAEVTITGNGTKTITGLPVDVEYTIVETTVDGMTTSITKGSTTSDKPNSVQGKVTANGENIIFTNTRELGRLEVDKSVFVNGEDKTSTYSNKKFYVKVSGVVDKTTYYVKAIDSNNYKATLTTDESEAEVFEINPNVNPGTTNALKILELPAGVYTVTEVADAQGTAIDANNVPGDMGNITFLAELSRLVDTAEVSSTAAGKAALLNAYTSGKYCLAVTKQWLVNGKVAVDNDNLKLYVILQRTTEGADAEESKWEKVTNISLGASTDEDGILELNKDNNWSAVAIGQDQMDSNGKRYSYRWVEGTMSGNEFTPVPPKGWIADKTETKVVQSATKNGTQLIFLTKLVNNAELTETTVTKIWEDASDQDGIRPEHLYLQLKANGNVIKTISISNAEADSTDPNKWIHKETGLPKYDSNGEQITYSWEELNWDVPIGYTKGETVEVKDSNNNIIGYNITNTHDTEIVNISALKKWQNASGVDITNEITNATVTFTLQKSIDNGNTWKDVTGESGFNNPVTLNGKETQKWTASWTDLPKYEIVKSTVDGKEKTESVLIQYRVVESNAKVNIDVATETIDVTPAVDEAAVNVTFTGNQGTASLTNTVPEAEAVIKVKKEFINGNLTDGQFSFTLTPTDENGTALEGGTVLTATNTGIDVVFDKITYTRPGTYYYVVSETEGNDESIIYDKAITLITVDVTAENGSLAASVLPVENGYSATFTNTQTGKLIITKTVEGGDASISTYKVSVENSDGKWIKADGTVSGSKVLLDVSAGSQITISGLPIGTYTVSEQKDGAQITGYELTVTGEGTAQLSKDNPEVTVDITNTYTRQKGSLKVKKAVTVVPENAADAAMATGKIFQVTVKDESGKYYATNGAVVTDDNKWVEISNEQTVIWSDLPTGTYTVEERTDIADVTGFLRTTTFAVTGSDDITGTVQVVKNNPAELTVTNKYELETVKMEVLKVWENNGYDNIPNSLEVTLKADGQPAKYADGTVVGTITLTRGANWKATVSNLPKYSNGHEIRYTWSEGYMPDGYSLTSSEPSDLTEGEGDSAKVVGELTTLTNTYTPGKTSVQVTKLWNDADNQDGKRPDSIYVKLSAVDSDGKDVILPETVSTVVALPKENSNWTHIWTELDEKTTDDKSITYSVTEVADAQGTALTDNKITFNGAEYTVTVSGNAASGFIITNTHNTESTEVPVTKIWDDANNQDGLRPTSITVILYADGVPVAQKILSAADVSENGNKWSYTFANLPKYKKGQNNAISYTVKEVLTNDSEVAKWEAYKFGGVKEVKDSNNNITGYEITNTHTPQTVSFTATKEWVDNHNQDNKRASITLVLSGTYQVGEQTKTYNIPDIIGAERTIEGDALNDDTHIVSWEGLPYKQEGSVVSYSVTEKDSVPGEDGKTIITLNGAEYEVSIDENKVTNTYNPETVDIPVTKEWEDNNDNDGKRPSEITLYLNREVIGEGGDQTEELYQTVTLTAENMADDGTWKYTFSGLPKYENGNAITYSVSEAVIDGYTYVVSPESLSTKSDSLGNGFTVTNTHTVETIDVEAKKVWNDNNNQDGKRASVTLLLSGNYVIDGVSKPIEIENAEKAITDLISNETIVKWEKLPKYKEGQEITYTVSEQNSVGEDGKTIITLNGAEYEVAIDGYTVTNTYIPETVNVGIHKEWDDQNNAAGLRPETLYVTLLKSKSETTEEGTEPTATSESEVVEIIPLTAEHDWTAIRTGLPAYENGSKLTYTWEEDVPAGYVHDANTDVISTTEDGILTTITNTCKVKTEATVIKVWDDENNKDNARPKEITVTLKAALEGSSDSVADETSDNVNEASTEAVAESGDTNSPELPADVTVTLPNEKGEWTATVSDLPKYTESGKEILYSWEEGEITGYELKSTDIVDTVTTLTNTHKPEETSINVIKAWDDSDNHDGIRPKFVTVELLADGVPVQETVLNDSNEWTGTFEKLPVNRLDDAGESKKIEYTVREIDVPEGYTAVVTYDEATGFTVTNTHESDVVEAKVIKIWSDNDNKDKVRPDKLTVKLTATADGKEIEIPDLDNVIELSAPKEEGADKNTWEAAIKDLPRFDDNKKEITYTWSEVEVPEGYQLTSVSTVGAVTTLVNTYGATGATIQKVWKDANNKNKHRPETLEVVLRANIESNGAAESVVYGEPVVLNEANSWTATLDNLPKIIDGKNVSSYSWEEQMTEETQKYYKLTETQVIGTVTIITNTSTDIPTTSAMGATKTWEDGSGGSVTLNLIGWTRDEEGNLKQYSVTSASGSGSSWSVDWTDLPAFTEDFEPIFYTLEEDGVERNGHINDDYVSSVVGDATTGWTVTNHKETTIIEQPTVEPPTYTPPTQPPTEPPTQPPTEPPTQPPTESPTQPPTESPTEPVTEPTVPYTPYTPPTPYTPTVTPTPVTPTPVEPTPVEPAVPETPEVPEIIQQERDEAEPITLPPQIIYAEQTPTVRPLPRTIDIEDYGTPLGIDVMINHVGDCFD